MTRTRPRGALVALAALVTLAGCSSSAADDPDRDRAVPASPSSSTDPSAEPSDAPVGPRYVALGDSYTSAPGVGDPTGPQGCLRTDGNYPHLLAERLGLALADVSCAGATSDDLRSPQATAGAGVAAQLDAVTPDTELVTLSVGANDDGLFGALAVQCAGLGAFEEQGPCSAGPRFAEDRLDGELAALARQTAASVRAVRRRAPSAQVVVVGYPQIVPASGSCADLPLDSVETPFVREVNRRLAAALARGARASGAPYVDMWAASEGHDACADEPWVAGLTPVGPGAPLHPTAEHQVAVADALEALVG